MDYERTLEQAGDDRQRAQQLSLQQSRPPTDVPGYEPEAFLGTGAYGEVWTATDRKTGRRVAIKFYAHRGGLDWSLLSREVEKLCLLFADRYVVQLLDVGWDADPPYYVMEYMARGALEDRLREGPLSVPEALSLFEEVATGLVHAHGKGVLHCDLKPANVLLDQDNKPRLADFGQSRLSSDQTPSLGTLFFMAPEQADLQAVPNARWDVYALGALLYTMLTGVPPYRSPVAETTLEQATDLDERLARYRQLLLESPAPREHRRVPGVDRHLAELIDRCLATDPRQRFPNIQAVLDALTARRIRRARQPLLVLGAGAPLLLLAVVSIFAYQGFSTALSQSSEAIVERALESNRFAAQFVAETVARQIDLRWQVLEREAEDAQLRQILIAASEEPRGSPAREQLQRFVDQMRARHGELDAASWFVTGPDGRFLARAPIDDKIIDKMYAYRDYFHGLGQDLPVGTEDLNPVTQVHRSNVFRSSATGSRMVAFSVPIWSGPVGAADRRVLGVMAMTVELGRFAELRTDGSDEAMQLAVLVDTRNDGTGKPGAILEHPYLTSRLEQNDLPLPLLYLPQEEVHRLNQLAPLKIDWLERRGKFAPPEVTATPVEIDEEAAEVAETTEIAPDELPLAEDELAEDSVEATLAVAQQLRELTTRPQYEDPVGGEFAGRWLAAVEPVVISDRPEAVRDTGWAVIVQERYRNATSPILALVPLLLGRSLIALLVVALAISVLWGLVFLVFNESPRSPGLIALRRRIGLSTLQHTPSTTAGAVAEIDRADNTLTWQHLHKGSDTEV